jgi:photosystem II stability/assembly factor-like uncharacterized protein
MLKLPSTALFISAAFFSAIPTSQGAVDFAFEKAIKQVDLTEQPLLDITHSGERLLAVGARGLIIASEDQGTSWRQIETPVSVTLTALIFTDTENGWAVGHAGTILRTSDGGDSWTLQFDGRQANEQFLAHTRTEADRLRAIVDNAPAELDPAELDELQYTLEDADYAIEDAESAVATGPADPFLDILMLDAQHGFAVGAYGMLYRTDDGGESWKLNIAGIDNTDRYHYYAMAADNHGSLYLSGEAGLLYHSRDGGDNWTRVADLYDGSLFGLVTSEDAVITFGLRGNIFRSTDRGETWSRIDTGESYSLYGGTVLESGEILLFGGAGQVLSSSDGGLSFEVSQHPARETFSSGISGPADKYLAVGMSGLEVMGQEEKRND